MTWQDDFKQAVSLHQAGRLPDAERCYEKVLSADPKNFPAQYQLAFLLYQQQRQPAALAAVESALKIIPDAREALQLHSVLLLNDGQYERALVSVSQVTARDARDAEAWHTRGVILAAARRFDEAVYSYDQALAAKPTLVASCCFRGNALMELKRYPEAVAAFDQALVHAPDLFDAWSNRGISLFEMERFSDALDSYDKALSVRSDIAPAWSNRGKALDRLQRFDDALDSYDKAIAIAPGNAEAWYARALTLRTMHRFKEALDSVDKALAVRAGHPPFAVFRGWVLCELDRIADGLAVIRGAAPHDPGMGLPISAHKKRHDDEQRDYLARQGVQVTDGELHIASGERIDGAAVNPANAGSAAAQWEKSRPRIVVIDNLLTDEALENLRHFCWSSSVWRSSYEDGYLGAQPEQGFACPLLAQIAEELRDAYPTIIGQHRLRKLWGFKYDSRLKGIAIHADQASINVNFWITPDDANLDREKGGMVIWDVAAPAEWDVRKYNGDQRAVRSFLERSGAKPVTIPYRANRAVIFDSDLFHETDVIDFKEGYLNRRINVTMLYGRRTYYGA